MRRPLTLSGQVSAGLPKGIRTRSTTASDAQPLFDDHHAKLVSANSAVTRAFHFFARPQRLARANEPKSRPKRTASESPGGMSVAKSRTVGLNSESQRRRGRRLFLPGCVDTAMDGRLGSDSLVAGNFPCFRAFPGGLPARKCRGVREFFHFRRRFSLQIAGNFRPQCREFGIALQGICKRPLITHWFSTEPF